MEKYKIIFCALFLIATFSCSDEKSEMIDGYFFEGVDVPIKTLDGVWESDEIELVVEGPNAKFSRINSGVWLERFYENEISIDDLKLREISKGKDLQWSCKTLVIEDKPYNLNGQTFVLTSTKWVDAGYGYIRMAEDGKSIQIGYYGAQNYRGGSMTLTRKVSKFLPRVSFPKLKSYTSNSVTFTDSILSTGEKPIVDKGICYSTLINPTISNNKISGGSGNTNFESTISGLNSGSIIYLRSYATNENGTAYSNQFTLNPLPIVTISKVTNISYNTATVTGSAVNAQNATNWGCCWSTSPNPTINDNFIAKKDYPDFSTDITGLQGNTKYYVRSYVESRYGIKYSENEISFTTTTDPNVISYGLRAYYNFNMQNANDLLGNFNGVTNSGITFNSSTVTGSGYCAQFNGTSGYINIPYQVFPSNSGWSLSMWIKSSQTTLGLYSIGVFVIDNSILSVNNNLVFKKNLSTILLNNNWHNLTITSDKNTLKYYIDNVLMESISTTTAYFNNYSSGSLGYASKGTNGWSTKNCYFSGLMDNVRFYNRALSESDISKIFNAKQ